MAKNIEINIKGSDGSYEVLYPKTNSVTSIVSDEVITNLGLTSGSSVNDALEWLSRYNLYWWRKRNLSYAEKLTYISSSIYVVKSESRNIQIANGINIDADGNVSLSSSNNFYFSNLLYMEESDIEKVAQEFVNKTPCYISNANENPTDIFYLPNGSTVGPNTSGAVCTIIWEYASNTGGRIRLNPSATIKAQTVSAEESVGSWQYLQSSDRNAYPDNGTQNGYEYEYLGIPYQQMSQCPNGVLIDVFEINLTNFGGTKLFNPEELKTGRSYYFTVDYDIVWTNNSGKSMQIGLAFADKSSRTITDSSYGFCYSVSYTYTITSGEEKGSSRLFYSNNAGNNFLCLYTNTSAYLQSFLTNGVYFNFMGPNLTTGQLNNITFSKANFTVKVYEQILC